MTHDDDLDGLYGGPQTRARARAWATEHRYRLVHRQRCCVHILEKRACPSTTRYDACSRFNHEAFDHGRVWQRPDGSRFLLAHVYLTPAEALRAAAPHAAARGFTVEIDEAGDWYGAGTVPLRYEVRADGD